MKEDLKKVALWNAIAIAALTLLGFAMVGNIALEIVLPSMGVAMLIIGMLDMLIGLVMAIGGHQLARSFLLVGAISLMLSAGACSMAF